MKLAATLLCALLAVLGSLAQDEPSKGSVSGTVMRGDTGTPMPDVDVYLECSSDSSGALVAVSSSTGQFEFAELEPCAYILGARRSGFSMISYSTRKGYPVVIGKNEKVTDLVLTLAPGGVIRGKVLDELGEPVIGASVKLLIRRYEPAATTYEAIDTDDTNDLGEFRLYGIPPGTYYLMAVPPAGEASEANLNEKAREIRASSYRYVYYDQATLESEAMPLRITPGSELVANFRLPRVRIANVHISLGIPKKFAEASGYIGMVPIDTVMSDKIIYENIRGEPSHTFKGVVPGRYWVGGILESPREGEEVAIGAQPVYVEEGENEFQVQVNIFGGTIKGRVHFDTDKHPVVTGLKVRFLPFRQEFFILDEPKGTDASIDEDGNFSCTTRLAARTAVRLEAQTTGFEDFYLKSVLVNGQESLTTGILSDARRGTIRVLVGSDGGSLSGRVADSKGKPVAGSTVVALPDAAHRNTYSCIESHRTGHAGRFSLRGICPGRYDVLALPPELPDGIYWDPEFVRMHLDQGVAITVNPNSRNTVELRPVLPVNQ